MMNLSQLLLVLIICPFSVTSLEISGDTLKTCANSSLSVPRVDTTIAVWKNIICVRGGLMTGDSADFFVDGVWNRTDQLSTERLDASAAAADSIMVFMGGVLGPYGSADFYDTRYKNWTTVKNILNSSRVQASAVGFGRLAFVAGGVGEGIENDTHSASAEIIDVHKRENIGLFPFPKGVPGVTGAAITKYGDDIVILGGGSCGNKFAFCASDAVLVFNGKTLNFSKVVYRLSTARGGLSAATLANKVFFIGGSTPTQSSDIIDIFDVHKGFSRSEMHLNTPRYDAAAATLSNKYIVVAGGYVWPPTHAGTPALASVELISSSNVTREHVTLTKPSFALVGASMGDRVFFAGGFYDGMMVRDAITFSPFC